VQEDRLPSGREFFAEIYRLWKEDGVDTLFRNAPHLLVVSAPKEAACPVQDCLIAMSTFELLPKQLVSAQCGMVCLIG